MPATQADGPLAQKLTNGTKRSAMKRKQAPENEISAVSTPLKSTKRVKTEALSPLNTLRKPPTRQRSVSRRHARAVSSESEAEPNEEQAPVIFEKTKNIKPKAKKHIRSDSDGEIASTSLKIASRVKAKVEVSESTAPEIEEELASPSKTKRKAKKKVTETIDLEKDLRVNEKVGPKGTPRGRKIKADEVAETTVTETKEEVASPSKKKTKTKTKVTETIDLDKEEQVDADAPKKTRRKRKTKEEKEAEAMPLAARTNGLRMFIGAHVSIATGVEKAVTNCVHIGGNAFALFLQSQRKWDNKPLLDENRLAFTSMCAEHKYNAGDHVLPHGSYLVNLAQEDKDKAKQAYDHFLDDLKRCEALGIKLYNFHPGAAGKAPLPEAINRISAQLNKVLAETHTAVPVLENMCGSGSVIGSRFSDLRDIIAGIKPEFKSRIGVCIDTCHAFAAGYDLRTPAAFQKTMQEFDDVVGIKYLRGLHVNDSKAPFGSHRDLHQNIGLGFLGLRAFHNVMNEPRFHNMPLILETPCDRIDPSDPTGKKTIEDKSIWAREIKLLESLIGMDPDGDEFKQLESDLSERGRASREKMQKAMDEKIEKAKKKLEKGQRSLLDMMSKNKKKSSESSSELSTLSEGEDNDE